MKINKQWLVTMPGIKVLHCAIVVDRVVPLLEGAPNPIISVFDVEKFIGSLAPSGV
jgi:hypothetical protein